MKALGWLLTIFGGAFAFYGSVIGKEIGIFGARVMHLPSILLGGILLIVGVMLLLFSISKEKNNSDNTTPEFNGQATLENDAYKIYLTKKYDINFNNALNKFICSDKLYDNIDEALRYAKELDLTKNSDERIVCSKCKSTNLKSNARCYSCKSKLPN